VVVPCGVPVLLLPEFEAELLVVETEPPEVLAPAFPLPEEVDLLAELEVAALVAEVKNTGAPDVVAPLVVVAGLPAWDVVAAEVVAGFEVVVVVVVVATGCALHPVPVLFPSPMGKFAGHVQE